MTAEESIWKTEEQKNLLNEYRDLQKRVKESYLKMAEINNELCKALPFKVGDFVEVETWRKHRGWIRRMEIQAESQYIVIELNPPRLDGTRSEREVVTFVDLNRYDEELFVKIKAEDQ